MHTDKCNTRLPRKISRWTAACCFLLLTAIQPPLYAAVQPETIARQGMVVSEQRLASQVGADILMKGGNAIDAAVAVGYALAVVNPCCGNIGGGGFMVIHLADGKSIFLNFRERAPLRATQSMYADKQGNLDQDKSINGYLAVGVPGTVLGLDTALQRYGTMTRQQVMQPAIDLAKQGFVLTAADTEILQRYTNDFQTQPNVAAIFLKNGRPYQAGEKLIQTDLGSTLALIAQQGTRAFYQGNIAKEIVHASQANGGILSLKDFAEYHVKESTPINCTYEGYTILTAAPPSAGGITLCEMLGILSVSQSRLPATAMTHYTQTLVETMRYGYNDRNKYLGDPDFHHNPVDQILAPAYLKQLHEKIARTYYNPSVLPTHEEKELTDTTHYSVIDKDGNAVAVTYTINGFFGARVIAGHTGFFLNNEMNDFTMQPNTANKFGLIQSQTNDIAPGKRPLSSMTPTIVLKDGRVFMILGSPGGSRIISTVLLTLLNVIDRQMPLQTAVDAPRFHYQSNPDVIDIEPFAIPAFTRWQLERQGYHFAPQTQWGAVEAILLDKNGNIHGANDRRRPAGAAIGY